MSIKFDWLNDEGRLFLSRGYLRKGVTAEERVRQIGDTAEKILGIEGYSDKFFGYFAKKYYSLSTPVWCNFGLQNLPISCNGSTFGDNTAHILTKVAEMGMMSKYGAGTSGYFGKIRPRGAPISTGGETEGPLPFIKICDTTNEVISQGQVRRGAMAVYLDVEHPDIEEFLDIRSDKSPIQHVLPGVCISDKWMEDLVAGNKENRKIWGKIVSSRFEKGLPYIFFSGTANKNKPNVYIDRDMPIYSSNLCCEIMLPATEDESFVCCLSSMNLETFDEWKDTDAVETLVYLLDAVMTEYIEKCTHLPYMNHARNFAERHRALGLGVLGWHSYLQANLIPFESMAAKSLTNKIFSLLQEKSLKASKALAEMFGEPELLKGYGRRNTTLLAVAPTKSSSFILSQTSEGIEPYQSNFQILDRAKITSSFKNPYLVKLLKSKNQDTKAVWQSILDHSGSVQHLTDILSDLEREVYKTAWEISQTEIVIQASIRQKYIDQGQSLNVFVVSYPNTEENKTLQKEVVKNVSKLMIDAWQKGVKSLYYQHNSNSVQQIAKSAFHCASCE